MNERSSEIESKSYEKGDRDRKRQQKKYRKILIL